MTAPAAEASATRLQTRSRVLAGGVLTVQLGAGLPSALYPSYADRWGLTPTALAGLFAALIAGVVIGLLASPALQRRRPARTLLLIACAFEAAGTLGYLWAASWQLLYPSSVALGLAIGGFSALAPAAMADPAAPEGHERTIGMLVTVANALGLAAGPIVGGGLHQVDPHAAFVLQLILIAALAAGIRMVLPVETSPRGQVGSEPGPAAVEPPLTRASFAVACAAGLCGFAVGGLYSALGSLVADRLLDVHATSVLGLVSTVLFSANAISSCFVLRLGVARSWQIGLLLVAFGLAGVTGAIAVASVLGFFVLTACTGAGQGLAIAAGTAEMSRRVSRSGGSTASATFFLVCYLGTAVPAFLTGVVAGLTSLETAMLVFCTLIGVLAVASVAIGRATLVPSESFG